MPQSAEKLLNELTAAGILSADEATKFGEEIAVGVEALLDRLVADKRITRYQADKFLAGKSSDIYFGDYIVLEELGKGGMGTVLLARHRRMDREVAIKVLPVTVLESETAVARFYQEVKVAAQLKHPNIVHAYDAGEHHGFHYLVMEYIRGHDLARVLEQLGPIPPQMALDYIEQAAQGLEYAHRKGVVHRDIKPSNLLLDDEGEVKILDMGLARIGRGAGIGHEPSLHLTTTGQVMGTVEYMSPEQAEDTRAADARSDIYSLGCTLYRLVTGHSPFSRDTMVKTILAHRESPIPLIAKGGQGDNPAMAFLNPLFQRMVAKNPDDRFQSTGELLVDIRKTRERLEQPFDTNFDPSQPLTPTVIENESATSAPATGAPFASPSVSSEAPTSAHISSANVPDATPFYIPPSGVGMPRGVSDPALIGLKHHRGKTILTMGVLSIVTASCLIGGILGMITWFNANRDLKEMAIGIRDSNGRGITITGKVLSIIGVVIAALSALSIVGPILGSIF